MLKKIVILILLATFSLANVPMAQSQKKKTAKKRALTVQLKMPKINKKNSIDWLKSAGMVTAGIGAGFGLYIMMQPEPEKPEGPLPNPPAWPGVR